MHVRFMAVAIAIVLLTSDGPATAQELKLISPSAAAQTDTPKLKCDQPFVFSNSITSTLIDRLFTKLIPCLQDGQAQELVINSNGGEAGTAYGAYDALRLADQDRVLTTTIYGNAHSAAAILFLAAETRRMSCNSYIMLHPPKLTMQLDSSNQDELDGYAGYRADTHDIYADIVSERTNLSREQVKALLENRKFHTATEMLDLGIATEVIGCE